MRTPPGVFANSSAVLHAAWADEGVGALDTQAQQQSGDEESLRALERAMQQFDVSGGPSPQIENSWNFTTMPADAALKQDDEDIQDDAVDDQRALAGRLARTLQHRPLMSRLSRVEAAYAELPTSLEPSEPPVVATVPPPLPPLEEQPQQSEQPEHVAPSRPIEELMEEFGEKQAPLPERSTAWLGNALRERTRAHIHNVAAWFATVAIGFSIIGIAVLMLQV